jgi:hypothetical protein
MDRKHGRTDDNGMQLGHEILRPSKHVRREQPELADPKQIAHGLTRERLRHIYGDRLEAGTARILILQAGSPSDEIECELRQRNLLTQVSLDDGLAYEALSYVWGEPESGASITLCGSCFPVTDNLAEALRHLRLTDRERLLWVDAICINQYDEEEKEMQVRSMHKIYRLAQRVIAWLGVQDNASNQAFGLMSIGQKLHRDPAAAAITLQVGNEDRHQDNAVRKFMERPYWSRAWIVQEMMVARSLVIQCGPEMVPYAALEKLFPPGKPAIAKVSSITSRSYMYQFYNSREQKIPRANSEHLSCKSFLDCFLDRKCHIRHDNIYAFLNLFGDDIRRKIRVRYGDQIHELVHGLARAMIESMQSLYIIVIRGRQKAPNASGDEWQLDMPSWCPYFATPYNSCPIETQHKPSLFAEKAKVSFGHDSLRVKGFVIGRVCRKVSRLGHRGDKPTDCWDQRDVDEEWKHYLRCLDLGLIDKREHLRTTLMSIEATTHTLLAGQAEGVSGIEMLQNSRTGHVEQMTIIALRDIWNIGKYRSVCAFQLGREARRALSLNNTPGAQRFNCVALAPGTVRLGDIICTIIGCPIPVVLRRMRTGYHVVGESYFDTMALGTFNVAVKLRDYRLR